MDDVTYLVGYISVTAAGVAISTAILFDRARTRLATAAVVGFLAVLFVESTLRRPSETLMIPVAALGGAAASFVSLFATWAFESWTALRAPEVRLWLRSELIPKNWWDITDPAPAPAKDLIARWFVAIAASTGSVVGVLMCNEEFWTSAFNTISPSHLIWTILAAVVSLVIIGPVEEHLLSRRLHSAHDEVEEDDKGNILTDFWENFSWRSAGRLLLVGLLILGLTVLHSVLDDTVKKGEVGEAFLIIVTASAPAITTYFWSAALQEGALSISRRAFRATTVFNAFLTWPATILAAVCLAFFGLVGAAHTASHLPDSDSGLGIVAIFLALAAAGLLVSGPLSIVYSTLTSGIAGAFGGWVLDRARVDSNYRGWKGLLLTGLGVSVLSWSGTAILLLTGTMAPALKHEAVFQKFFLEGPMAAFGWMVGLALSGFPKILVRSADKVTGNLTPVPPEERVATYWQLVTGDMSGSTSSRAALVPAAEAAPHLPPTAEELARARSEERKESAFAIGVIFTILFVFNLQNQMRAVHSAGQTGPKSFFTDLKKALPRMLPRKPPPAPHYPAKSLSKFSDQAALWPPSQHSAPRAPVFNFKPLPDLGAQLDQRISPLSLPDGHAPIPASALGVVVDLYGERLSVHDDFLMRDIPRLGMEVTGPASKTSSDNRFNLQAGERIVAIDDAWVSTDIEVNRRLLGRGSKIKSIGIVDPSSRQLHIKTVNTAGN